MSQQEKERGGEKKPTAEAGNEGAGTKEGGNQREVV